MIICLPHKGNSTRLELYKVSPILRAMVLYAASLVEEKYGADFIITCVLREGDTGVHGHGRGVDADNDTLKVQEKVAIEKAINTAIVYDESRPNLKACFYHTVPGGKRGGDHWHFQVCSKTKFRGL